jgi:crotonobetainyl-CoA:carnitine CoA-transferase CaiB-like acyl-CoA transferase
VAAASRIPRPTAGWVPNIESPVSMGLTPAVDLVAAPLLGEHTRDILRETLGYDELRIAELADKGEFGAGQRSV